MTLTFLLTDVVASTRLWELDPGRMRSAIERHDRIADHVASARRGRVVKARGEGDSLFMVFPSAIDAVMASLDFQRTLAEETWSTERAIVVRAAVHTGDAYEREGDWYGPALNRAARIRSAAHGGQILASDRTAAIIRDELDPSVILEELGTYRLKDLADPERLWQVSHSSSIVVYPPPLTIGASLNNVPVVATPFIGREHELRRLADVLLGDRRLLTITGIGGCGKTRLALQLAADMAERFRDGVFFVSAEHLTDGDDLLPHLVADALGLENPCADPARDVAQRLASRTLLLVLDNLEHIADRCGFLTEWIRACGDSRILATSRTPLSFAGEAVWPLGSMDVPPDFVNSMVDLLTYDSAALLVERLRACDPDVPLTNDVVPTLAEICRRADGIPLALELAAAMGRTLGVRALADYPHFPSFEWDVKDVPQRHRSLDQAFTWSYETLTSEERLLLARFAIFPGHGSGGFEAIGQVCGQGLDAHRVLASLVDKSLIERVRSETKETRFRLLSPTREFVLRQSEVAAVTQSVVQRLGDWVVQIGGTARSDGMEPWYTYLVVDEHNLRAGVEALLAQHRVSEAIELFRVRVYSYWSFRGRAPEGLYIAERLAEAADMPREQASTLRMIGHFATVLGDYSRARSSLSRSLRLERIADRVAAVATCLNSLAGVDAAEGKLEEARDHLEEALSIRRGREDPSDLGETLLNLSWVQQVLGELKQARELSEEGLACFERLGVLDGQAVAHRNLGSILLDSGHWGRSQRHLDRATELLAPMGDEAGLSLVKSLEAARLLGIGDAAGAVDAARRALSLAEASRDAEAQRCCMVALAEALRGNGAGREAAVFASRAREASERSGDLRNWVAATRELAEVSSPESQEGELLWISALRSARKVGAKRQVIHCLLGLARSGSTRVHADELLTEARDLADEMEARDLADKIRSLVL